jgi:uncharacterized protein (TIGR03085 family)
MSAGLAAAERAKLCDLLDEVGPAAPTLCDGWLTHDLAAHMVARERQPLAAAGIVVSQLHPLTELFESRYRQVAYPELVRRLRAGPVPVPLDTPVIDRLDERFNLHEMFIHHEDVRRPQGLAPRRLAAPLQDALWQRVKVLAPRFTRRLGDIGVDLQVTGRRRITAHEGEPVAVIEGSVGEVFLYLWNRKVARVRVRGSLEAIAAVRETKLGE